ncbi:hypothetical protein CapIbe_014343 [Capra ibex]
MLKQGGGQGQEQEVCESESEVAQSCLTLCDPWIVAYQAPPSMEFSREVRLLKHGLRVELTATPEICDSKPSM